MVYSLAKVHFCTPNCGLKVPNFNLKLNKNRSFREKHVISPRWDPTFPTCNTWWEAGSQLGWPWDTGVKDGILLIPSGLLGARQNPSQDYLKVPGRKGRIPTCTSKIPPSPPGIPDGIVVASCLNPGCLFT